MQSLKKTNQNIVMEESETDKIARLDEALESTRNNIDEERDELQKKVMSFERCRGGAREQSIALTYRVG